jgi:hypothetical protein
MVVIEEHGIARLRAQAFGDMGQKWISDRHHSFHNIIGMDEENRHAG